MSTVIKVLVLMNPDSTVQTAEPERLTTLPHSVNSLIHLLNLHTPRQDNSRVLSVV